MSGFQQLMSSPKPLHSTIKINEEKMKVKIAFMVLKGKKVTFGT